MACLFPKINARAPHTHPQHQNGAPVSRVWPFPCFIPDINPPWAGTHPAPCSEPSAPQPAIFPPFPSGGGGGSRESCGASAPAGGVSGGGRAGAGPALPSFLPSFLLALPPVAARRDSRYRGLQVRVRRGWPGPARLGSAGGGGEGEARPGPGRPARPGGVPDSPGPVASGGGLSLPPSLRCNCFSFFSTWQSGRKVYGFGSFQLHPSASDLVLVWFGGFF